MTTALNYYAFKESVMPAIRWTGTNTSYREIKHWLAGDVQLRDGTLLISMGNHLEPIAVGNYVALISGSLLSFTPEELTDDYVKVEA